MIHNNNTQHTITSPKTMIINAPPATTAEVTTNIKTMKMINNNVNNIILHTPFLKEDEKNANQKKEESEISLRPSFSKNHSFFSEKIVGTMNIEMKTRSTVQTDTYIESAPKANTVANNAFFFNEPFVLTFLVSTLFSSITISVLSKI